MQIQIIPPYESNAERHSNICENKILIILQHDEIYKTALLSLGGIFVRVRAPFMLLLTNWIRRAFGADYRSMIMGASLLLFLLILKSLAYIQA